MSLGTVVQNIVGLRYLVAESRTLVCTEDSNSGNIWFPCHILCLMMVNKKDQNMQHYW